ncbi:MAG: BamA/TamA family outer membrane protein [bacterium]
MSRILTITLLILSLIAVAFAADDEKMVIKKVEITGFTAVTEAVQKESYAVIKSKVGDPFSDAQAEEDQLALIDLGWYFRATHKTEELDGGVKLIFTVVENPVIKDIIIKGNTVFTSNELKKMLTLKPGEVLFQAKVKDDAEIIRKKYAEKGYSLTDIASINIDDASSLVITIMEPRIDQIKIEGNTKTKNYVIERELMIKSGDLFNENEIRKTLSNLNRLSIFQEATVVPQPGTKPGTINLVFKVRDARTGQIGLGVGYSQAESFSGMLNLADNNLFGTARSVSASLQIGSTSSYNLTYNNPWIDRQHTSFNTGIFDTQTITQMVAGSNNFYYTEARKGARVGFTRPYGKWLHGISFRLDKVYGFDVPTTLPVGLAPLVTEIKTPIHNQTITYTSQRDTRNSWLNATKGDYLSLSSELAGFGGDSHYSKWDAEYRYFMPLDKAKPTAGMEYSTKDNTKLVLASRFQAGYIAGKAPFLEQFRLGGLDTIRGYEDEQFPGINKVLLNTELRYQPAEVIQLAAFADYGDAWGGDFSQMVAADSKLRMRLGYGVGIRVMVPMLGPIRFDYGFTSKGKNRFIFGIGSIY